jgi:hypothetical protein
VSNKTTIFPAVDRSIVFAILFLSLFAVKLIVVVVEVVR